MEAFESEKQGFEAFIRSCGLTPQHNFFIADRNLGPIAFMLIDVCAYRWRALEPGYLLVFTQEEVILKVLHGKLTEENYEEGLTRIAREDIKDFWAQDLGLISEYCISFRYRNSPFRYYFYIDPYGMYGLSSLNYSQMNFRFLLENGFYGLLEE